MKQPDFDKNLIAAFNAGDIATFSKVYRTLYPAIYHFANKLIADESEAKDIASETFIKVWHKRSDLVSYENIKAFAYIVARNACFNHLQSVHRKSVSHKEILYLNSELDEQLINYEMINADVIQELHRQIELLPPQCGLVFKRMFFEGKNSTQVAESMGITRKTVLNQKLKAIALLRAALLKKNLLPAAMALFAYYHESGN
ncbi:MAG TPA: sigma-70 family RNA polymerase sigma factor [Chitinophagaceae bacterium]|nr:sigma-70 family RNA polymerase sigma factor [Chitinophagaceae bacterium]